MVTAAQRFAALRYQPQPRLDQRPPRASASAPPSPPASPPTASLGSSATTATGSRSTILFVMRPVCEETDQSPRPPRPRHRPSASSLATAVAECLRGDDSRPRPPYLTLAAALRLRPAHRPVRALHRRDHHLRRADEPTRSERRPSAPLASGPFGTALGIVIACAAFVLWPSSWRTAERETEPRSARAGRFPGWPAKPRRGSGDTGET